MSIICIVCRDPLTEGQGEGEGEGEPQGAAAYPAQRQGRADIVATKCGHLYHFHCLIGWFNTQATQGYGIVVGECPYCKTLINGPTDFLKIFPSGDEESDALQAANSQAALLRRRQDNDLREELRDSQMRLEEESLNHDILKCEHSEALAEVDRLKLEKEKLEENMNMKEAGHSLKCETLTGQVTSLTAQLLERTILTETLRKKNEESENNLQELTEQIQELKNSVAENSLTQKEDAVDQSCQTEYQDTEDLKCRVASFDNCLKIMATEKRKLEELLAGRDALVEIKDFADRELRPADVSIAIGDVDANATVNDGQADPDDIGLDATSLSYNTMSVSLNSCDSDAAGDGSINSNTSVSSVSTSPDAQRKGITDETAFVDCSSDPDDSDVEVEVLPNPPTTGNDGLRPNFVLCGQRQDTY